MGVVTRALTSALPIEKRRAGPNNGTTALASVNSSRRIGKANPHLYRNWARYNPWVRAGFDIRIGQIQRADWDLVQFDREGPAPDKGLMRRMREVLERPNPGMASLATFMGAVCEDVLTLDAGSIEKERQVNGEVAYLWETDGGAIKVDRLWSGNPRQPRYYFCPDPMTEIPLLNSDLTYLKIHNLSSSPVGISYLETLQTAIDAELALMLYNVRTVKQAAPDGIMDLGENARDTQVEKFKAFWDAEIAGQGMMSFWGGTKGAKFIDFHKSNHDMQMMEFYTLIVRIFAVVMQLSIQDLGLGYEVNKANGEVQARNTESRGFQTLAGLAQDYITAEVIWDPGWGGRKNNIAFRYLDVSDRQSKELAETHKLTLAGMPSESINEARRRRGQKPIGDLNDETNPFNQLMANTSQGLVTLSDIPSAREVAMRKQPAEAGGDEDVSEEAKPALRRVKQLNTGEMALDPDLEELREDLEAITVDDPA